MDTPVLLRQEECTCTFTSLACTAFEGICPLVKWVVCVLWKFFVRQDLSHLQTVGTKHSESLFAVIMILKEMIT